MVWRVVFSSFNLAMLTWGGRGNAAVLLCHPSALRWHASSTRVEGTAEAEIEIAGAAAPENHRRAGPPNEAL
jgi:hypothetical protein